jgi:hypothetical protein
MGLTRRDRGLLRGSPKVSGDDVVELPPLASRFVEGHEVKVFSDSALQAAIDRTLQSLPEGEFAAVVDVARNPDGTITGAAAVRLAGGWSLMGGLAHTYNGDWTAVGQLRWSGGR